MVGCWAVSLGHQRLSIIDLSAAGTQPMKLGPRGQLIVYNGEIYNYVELKRELVKAGFEFQTRTDTEVILVALQHWGLEDAHRRFNGMWAFAWLDIPSARLVLSRDRAGEKPLYVAEQDGALVFASEIKTLLTLSGRHRSLQLSAVGRYLTQSLLDDADETLLSGVRRLPAGTFGVIDLSAQQPFLDIRRYWQWKSRTTDVPPLERLADEIRDTFQDSVRIRLRSDVPLGVLLSGGIDSSAIASVARDLIGPDQLHLLASVSDDPRFDESPHIDRMAAYLNRPVTKVHLDLNPDNAVRLLERACWFHDEPVTSLSHVAHYLLMEKARELGITVILSGQGADELLCGYKKYLGFYIQWLLRRGALGRAAGVLAGFWRNGTILPQFSLAEARRYLPRAFHPVVPDVRGPALRDQGEVDLGLGSGSVEARQYLDLTRYSVPALCHKEDRMSMAHSREIRLPFLDVRLIERLLETPVGYKLRGGWTKYVFRSAMAGQLPAAIVWRKDKLGFVNPQEEWLKGRLKPVVLDLFGPESFIFKLDLLDRARLLLLYERYCRQPAGRGTVWYREIFGPVALEVWLRQFAEWVG
jgi:asparagine synthase (glutamine-hydrolysing)